MTITATTQSILDKVTDGGRMSRDEALYLLGLPLHSDDCYLLMAAANRFSHTQAQSRGTIYSQVGINVWPCPENCDFCYLGSKHGLIKELHELSPVEVTNAALNFEVAGADEVYLMTTANYPFDQFIEIGQTVRRALQPQTILVANIGDFKQAEAYRLVDAGFDGVYHVYRFREGAETEIEPERRRATFAAIRAAGLDLRYCIEPIGPEHSAAEIVEQMALAQAFGATILSVMRRIPVAGTPYAGLGHLSEIEIARVVAIARLFLGEQVRQMGVHEPSMVSLRAGAHRICAEVGMNPRDRAVDTAKGRGLSVAACEQMLWEAGFAHGRRQLQR
ncbi:MAG: radical SAM protein [Caldilinea sp. CFX5]|nr:radical SAM protein [Caldilinea sp. CFX5]